MNWHVLVIMQSFISHRFLFIGKCRKIPEELTESFNHNRFLFNMARSGRWIFSHICALMACFHLPGAVVQKKTEDSGSAPWRVGPPSIHGVDQAAEVQVWTDLCHQELQGLGHAWCNRHWGGQGKRFCLLQSVFPALSWMQMPLACSEQLSSPRSLAKVILAV